MMVEFVQRHRPAVLLLVLSFFSFLCMALRVTPIVAGLKAVVWFLASPSVVYSGQFFNKVDSVGGRFFRLVLVEGENEILRNQNIRLSKKEVERDTLEEENNRLRTLLGLRQKNFPEAVSAEVVARDPREWFQSLVLDKGSEDGVASSAAVVTGSVQEPVLVGRVGEAQATTSKVLLMTDAVSAITVTVVRNGHVGLLEGRGGQSAVVRYLPPDSDVVAGDRVVTVGMGGLFPPGVLVGEVASVSSSVDGFFREARIHPAVDLGAVRTVLVVERREEPTPATPAARAPATAAR